MLFPGVPSNAAPVIVTVCPHAPVPGEILPMLGTPTLIAIGVVGVSVVPEEALTLRMYWLTGVVAPTLIRKFVFVPMAAGATASVGVFVGPKPHVIPVGKGATQLNVTEP